jgi:OFA family oxalate/formate antiporter-like MFS transporter
MKKSFFYGYVIISSVFILQAVMSGPKFSFGVFIKPITAEFDWSRALVSGAFSVSSIVMGLSSILMGWLNDRIGPRKVLTICGILVGSGLMLMFFVHSAGQLYLFYSIIIGLGMGGLIAPQMSTITRWFFARRNIMIGLLLAGAGLGGIICPPLITWLIYTYNWREAFLFVGIVVFILVILLAQFLKRDPSQIGQIPYQKGNDTRRQKLADVEELSLVQALHTMKFWMFSFIMLTFGFFVTTITVHIVPYAIDRGISPASAAMILAVMSMALPVGSIIIGFVADKMGSRRMLIICQCFSLGVLLFLLPVKSAWVLDIFVVVLALGAGGVGVLQATVVAELFGLKSNGIILGVNSFVLTFGSSLGAFTAGSLFDATGNYQSVFLLCGVLVVAAIIMAIFLNRIRKAEALITPISKL